MENLIIKRKSSDQESLKTKVSNSVKRIDYIKVEPGDGSDPKLIIANCETCETPIDLRLIAIKQEYSSPSKPVIKVEPSEITESINVKTCNSLALTSSVKSSNSIGTSDMRCPDISNVEDNNSPARSVKWKPISFDNLKRSDSPSLSSQKDSFFPYIPRRSFNDNRRSWRSSSQHKYQRQMYHPYKNYNHKNFNNSRNKYYHGRHKLWNNFPQHKRLNKENNFIVKNEVKAENALRIIKIISLNNNPLEKTNANTLKEQNHPSADSPSTSTLVFQNTNFHTNSFTILDKIYSGTQCSKKLFSNEVTNNVIQQQQKNSNESVFDISSCEVNDSDDTKNCVKDIFEIQDAISGENEDKSTNKSTEISKALHIAYETGEDSRNACSDDVDETNSSDCCFILANANESEVTLLIDKIYDSEYNTENDEEATGSINNIKFNEDGDKETDIIIVKEPESNNNGEKEVNIDVEDDVDAEVEEMLKELEIEYEIINESEELNLSEAKNEIVELLHEAYTEVEVVKEIHCDAEIECIFSKVKEAHLCTRCFVEKRKRKRNKDIDVIFLRKKVTSKNIPVISIDEAEG